MAVISDEGSKALMQVLKWYPNLPKPIKQPVHQLIQEQSEKRSEAIAVCSWDGEISFKDLEQLSSQLADYILTQGVGAEVIVPLVFEKSKWMIVSLLAVLKAGGTFLMLDPSQPMARLQALIKQTRASFAMASVDCSDICRSLMDNVFVVNAENVASLSQTPKSLPSVDLSNSAYIIFTSGSTGTPKGVIIEHAQLSTTSTYVGQKLAYNNCSRVFQFASYAFDACITDIFATLVHGGTICIPSEWERNNDIIGAMRRTKVTHAKFTPSLAGNLALDEVTTLRTLIFGGENPPTALVRKWSAKLQLVLVYGPTECCVICFTTNTSDHETEPAELGTPVASRGWITRPENPQELVAMGEVGELLIEGPLVGRGYLDDFEKTKNQFIINPAWMPEDFIRHEQRRLYRTGDLAKYLSNGHVCYVGRLDNQVKIRGQRLELEEVEKALWACLASMEVQPDLIVVEAITFPSLTAKHLGTFLCFEGSDAYGHLDWESDEVKLVSTIQTQQNFADVVSKIRNAMVEVLPAYAVPTIWIPVKKVPYTISRKIDRKRLRSLVATLTVKQLGKFSSSITGQSNGANTTTSEAESKLQQLWAAIFDVPASSIDRNDDFFSLGGDSVLAIKLVAAARSHELALSLELVFKHPILHEMALNTSELQTNDQDACAPAPFSLLPQSWDLDDVRKEASLCCEIPFDAVEDVYPCSPMQEGLIALSMKDPGTYVLQFVYQMPGSVDLTKLRNAWETVAMHTQVMRTRFFDYKANLLQAVIKEAPIWKVVEGDLAEFLVTEKSLKMTVGQAMSRYAVVLQPNSSQYFLVFTIHHALIDGWSESDIVTMVEKAYIGDISQLSLIPSFSCFIRYLGEQNTSDSKIFWKQDLSGTAAPKFPPLPSVSYVPKVERSSRVLHHLDSHADAEIEHQVHLLKNGSFTPATMIQAAWLVVMGLYSSSHDVVTGMTLNGRAAPIPGIDQIPGPTVTTIPFRIRLIPEHTVGEFLKSIQTQYLSILPHVQYGLQNIRAVSDDAVIACKFRTLLVVQSANRPQSSRKLLMGRSYSFPVMDFALVMECELVNGSVEFRVTFDHQILNEVQVRQLLQMMERILQEISSSGPETTVADLQKTPEKDRVEIDYWHRKITEQVSQQTSGEDMARKLYRAPSSYREKILADMWKTLLQEEVIGIDDNFFYLGGGSVSAMRLVSMARREGITLTVSDIFKAPVLSRMALLARDRVDAVTVPRFSLLPESDVTEIRHQAALQCHLSFEEVEDIYPVHAMQLHYITGYPETKRDVNGPWDWQSQAVYTLPPTIDIDRFQKVWHNLVCRHQTLRTRAIRYQDRIFQAVTKPSKSLNWGYSTDLETYLQSDRNNSMTFGDELLRLAVVKDFTGWYFVITLQHFIYDGFARQMLFRELEAAYHGETLVNEPPKMNKLIKYSMTADKEAAISYWTEYLSNVESRSLLDVPEHCYKMDIKEETIVVETPQITRTTATLPTVIETVCGLVLAHRLGCPDIVLYSDRSGRNLPVEGIQDLIGPVTLFLPIRVHLDASQDISNLLSQAQQAQQDMLPHEHLGWLELREMTPFRYFYRQAINININPNALASYDRLGLEYKSSYATVDDPFGINVDLHADKISWTIYFDERFISCHQVQDLLTQFENLLNNVSQAIESGQTVGELLKSIAQ